MDPAFVAILVAVVVSLGLGLWRSWLALFPGFSLHADYGIRGGWFGTRVTFKGTGPGSGRSCTY